MKAQKNTYFSFQKYRLLLICMLLSFSCVRFDEVKSPIDGLKVLINYNIFNSFMSFRFVDASTGSLIGATDNQKVKVKITGPSSAAIVDQLGNHQETYESVFGLLSLALNPKDPWKPSSDNILSFQIDATSANYKAVNLTLQIDSTGKYEYRVMMEKTNVDALGMKKYFFQLDLNDNGELKEDFSFHSTGNESSIELKKGTQFQNANGDVEKSPSVSLTFTVYTKLSTVPVPNTLLSDVILKDQSVQKSAFDIYRAVDIQLKNSTSETLTTAIGHPISMRYNIGNNAYHPVSKKTISKGNDVQTYTFQQKSAAWQLNDALKLQSDSLGYFVQSETNNFGLHSAGMHINVCDMSGKLSYKLQGLFPTYPVSTLAYLYRKIDSRYIGYVKIDIPEKGHEKEVSFKAPENTPVRVYIRNYSSSNSFTAKPDYFDHEAGCGTFASFETSLKSSAVEVSGKVKVVIGEGFTNDDFMVKANLYNSSNNGLLWSKQYKIGKSSNEFDIFANLPANTNVYLQIQAVDNENTFESIPSNYSFNTNSGKGLTWQYSISPLFTMVNFNFNFTRSTDLPNVDYMVKGELTNMANQEKEGNFVFQVKPGQDSYTTRLFLSKLKRYQVNLKRVDGAAEFIAYPYEFKLGYLIQKDYPFTCELSNVVRKSVSITVKVVCSQSEIIPSLHGYYRTVWEDEWKEGDIVNGVLKITCEMNATYVIGLIVDGQMETTTYKIDGTNLNFNFELSNENCAQMGW